VLETGVYKSCVAWQDNTGFEREEKTCTLESAMSSSMGGLVLGPMKGGDAFLIYKYRHCSPPMPSLVSRDHSIEADTTMAFED